VAVNLTYGDLLPFAPDLTEEQGYILIRGVVARAALVAPCILESGFAAVDAARDILIAAVLRRHLAGGGIVTQQTVGNVSVTLDKDAAGRLLLESEDAELRAMCSGAVVTYGPLSCFPAAQDWPDPVERR
jgi:hypothetical protein